MVETIQQRIQKLGWKQGQVFDGALKDVLVSHATEQFSWVKEADACILFSQDCDLQHHSLENEPFVEFLCAQSIEACDINFRYGKNPRRLHVEDRDGTCFHVQMAHRIRILRDLIDESFPVTDKELTKEFVNLCQRWFLGCPNGTADLPFRISLIPIFQRIKNSTTSSRNLINLSLRSNAFSSNSIHFQ